MGPLSGLVLLSDSSFPCWSSHTPGISSILGFLLQLMLYLFMGNLFRCSMQGIQVYHTLSGLSSFRELLENFLRFEIFLQQGLGRPNLDLRINTRWYVGRTEAILHSSPQHCKKDKQFLWEETVTSWAPEKSLRLSSCMEVVLRAPWLQLSWVVIPVGLDFSVMQLLWKHPWCYNQPSTHIPISNFVAEKQCPSLMKREVNRHG